MVDARPDTVGAVKVITPYKFAFFLVFFDIYIAKLKRFWDNNEVVKTVFYE